MARTTINLPRYMRGFCLKDGSTGYYWTLPKYAQPPAVRRGRTCPVKSEALGQNIDIAIGKANVLNEIFDGWRLGVEKGPTKGSVIWLFQWYQQQDRFTSKSSKARTDYAGLMQRLADQPMRVGTFGQRLASAVDAMVADKMYARWRAQTGERQAGYAMQVCRLVWTWAARHHKLTGVTHNPFSKMGIVSKAANCNRETSRNEYDLYRETARQLGHQSMATAAALSFELCQRVWDVFGFVDPDGIKACGFFWADYKPGKSINYVQSKTGKVMAIPLIETVDGEKVRLFPVLEDELKHTLRQGPTIVVDEKTGLPLTYDQMNKRHRKICAKAGLPKEMTFTGFRHGGITELGNAGIDDTRAISGHAQLQTTAIYNRASQAKAQAAQLARNKYLSEIASEN